MDNHVSLPNWKPVSWLRVAVIHVEETQAVVEGVVGQANRLILELFVKIEVTHTG